jgi:hypothetical protein
VARYSSQVIKEQDYRTHQFLGKGVPYLLGSSFIEQPRHYVIRARNIVLHNNETVNIYRNLRAQQMSVLVFIVHFLHYMFRPLLVAIFRWYVTQQCFWRQLLYVSTDPLRQYVNMLDLNI